MKIHIIDQNSHPLAKYSCKSTNPALNSLIYLAAVCLLFQGCAETGRVVPRPDSGLTREDVRSIPGAIPRYEPRSRSGNPRSYVVFGKRYRVLKQSKGFVQTGLASWYGKKFHGRRTSNGEIYNMYRMTAAHKTLPLPTYVQVTNLGNGRRLIVRVNDRGPFHRGRIIDLSYAAARKLGILRAGTARVEVKALEITPDNEIATPARSNDSPIYVQVGGFADRTKAEQLLENVNDNAMPSLHAKPGRIVVQPVYRVQFGPVNSIGEAQRIARDLNRKGFSQTKLVRDEAGTSHAMLR